MVLQTLLRHKKQCLSASHPDHSIQIDSRKPARPHLRHSSSATQPRSLASLRCWPKKKVAVSTSATVVVINQVRTVKHNCVQILVPLSSLNVKPHRYLRKVMLARSKAPPPLTQLMQMLHAEQLEKEIKETMTELTLS